MPDLRRVNFAILLVLAWLLLAAALLASGWTQTGRTLLDTDDAMRLVQLRGFLGGQGWFDLHQPRLQPPLGYDSHWSRLVDAGLAVHYSLFRLFADAGLAERLLRATWPLLWLFPAMAATAATAWRLGGRQAALLALLLAMLGIPAYQQFSPGRIDHHNVQIAMTLAAAAATLWSDRLRWCAPLAGALTALTLAIGFEALPYLALCAAVMALRVVQDARAAAAASAYGLALGGGLAALFAVSVAPSHWSQPHCDALAINSLAGFAGGGVALAAATWLSAAAQPSLRLAAVLGAGVVSLGAFLAVEPACIRGPYAEIDPAIWPIWLAEVREMQPLLRLWPSMPLTAVAIAAFPAAAVLAALALARDGAMRRDLAFLAAAALLAAACAFTIGAIRAYSYAIWFGMPLAAVFAQRLLAASRMSLVGRVLVGLLCTPAALSSGAIMVAAASGLDDTESFARPRSKACFESDSFAPLAQLPPGLVATDVSFGPFMLALTPHAVLAGPYHRLGSGIVTAHRALASPPAEARLVIEAVGARYVAVCGAMRPTGLSPQQRDASLWGHLSRGDAPDWLAPVATDSATPFRVFAVKR